MYERIYYETIRDLGIDPVVPADLRVAVTVGPEGCVEEGSSSGSSGSSGSSRTRRPAQLAEKALAKATGSAEKAPRKRAVRKATGTAKVPTQTPAKPARGTARAASSA